MVAVSFSVVANKTPGTLPLIDGDGAVGDPASKSFSFLVRTVIEQGTRAQALVSPFFCATGHLETTVTRLSRPQPRNS